MAAATFRSATVGSLRNRSRMAVPTAPIATWAVKAANPPSRAALGNGLPMWRSATSVAGTVEQVGRRRTRRAGTPVRAGRTSVVELTRTKAVRAQSGEEVDLVHQRGIDHDDAVGGDDGLPGADVALAQTAIGHHRRTRALRTEAGERLRVPTLLEGRERQQVCGGDDTLAAPAVQSHFEHDSSLPTSAGRAKLVPKVPAPSGTHGTTPMEPVRMDHREPTGS